MQKTEPIGAGGAIRELTLAEGVTVQVRRASKTVQSRIVEAANIRGVEDIAGMVRVQELTIRWGVTGAEGLKRFDSDEPLAFSQQKHAVLGSIAASDVYDSLAEIDGALDRIAACIESGALTEADKGN